VRQALAGEPLTVFGDGSQTRSFADVTDVVRALIGLAAEPRAAGDVFNVGNPEEVSILALARRVLDVTGSRSPIVTVPYDEAYETGFEDLPRRVPDVAKIRTLIGWTPTVGLAEILARVVAHERACVRPAGVYPDR
jgi:UDP-glucose 4-epimerase